MELAATTRADAPRRVVPAALTAQVTVTVTELAPGAFVIVADTEVDEQLTPFAERSAIAASVAIDSMFDRPTSDAARAPTSAA